MRDAEKAERPKPTKWTSPVERGVLMHEKGGVATNHSSRHLRSEWGRSHNGKVAWPTYRTS